MADRKLEAACRRVVEAYYEAKGQEERREAFSLLLSQARENPSIRVTIGLHQLADHYDTPDHENYGMPCNPTSLLIVHGVGGSVDEKTTQLVDEMVKAIMLSSSRDQAFYDLLRRCGDAALTLV